jgi:hypothetical protein
MTCLDDEFVQYDMQLAFFTVIFANQSLLTVNIIRHATYNAIWNTLMLSNSEHFPIISWLTPIMGTPGAQRA